MKNPFVPVVIAYVIGILAQTLFDLTPTGTIVAALCLGIAATWCYTRPLRGLLRTAVLMVFIAVVASTYTAVYRYSFATDHLKHLVGPERHLVKVRGRIVDPLAYHAPEQTSPYGNNGRSIFVLAAEEILTSSGWAPVTGKIRTTVYGPPATHLALGQPVARRCDPDWRSACSADAPSDHAGGCFPGRRQPLRRFGHGRKCGRMDFDPLAGLRP